MFWCSYYSANTFGPFMNFPKCWQYYQWLDKVTLGKTFWGDPRVVRLGWNAFPNNRQVKHHVYGKREFVPPDPFCCRLLFIISTHNLVVSRNFLSIRVVLSCFYLLIFDFEKFSIWIWRLPFAVYVKLSLSNVAKSSPINDARCHASSKLDNAYYLLIYFCLIDSREIAQSHALSKECTFPKAYRCLFHAMRFIMTQKFIQSLKSLTQRGKMVINIFLVKGGAFAAIYRHGQLL